MNPNQAIESFDYFVGKVCSIHTQPTNWKLSLEQTPDYYVGLVNLVNECGVCITNVINHKKTFIMMPAVVAIAEETTADPADPEDQKMLLEYEEKKKKAFEHNPRIFPPAKPPNAPIDLATITKQVQAAKRSNQV